MEKLCYIISCFDEYESRNKFVENFFIEQGYKVKTFISDFHHQKKEKITVMLSIYIIGKEMCKRVSPDISSFKVCCEACSIPCKLCFNT